jgi:hypothetical protein
MAQIALCHLPGPFWICHDTKIRQKKKNTGFFHRGFFAKFRPEKYDFNPIQRIFSWEKSAKNLKKLPNPQSVMITSRRQPRK